MIPKIIWQTYKIPFEQLPQYAKDAAQTWKELNPEYKYIYMDDEEAANFVLHEYGEEWYNIFINCPIGVMRGDIWRYLIINTYGGVYVDLDTHCTKPLKEWLNNDYDLVICIDDDAIHFGQYAFAGSPNNTILQNVIKNVKNKIINCKYEHHHDIHQTTGNIIWTKSIKEMLGIENKKNIYIHNNWRDFHEGGFIKHLIGHLHWDDGRYIMWEEEAKQYIKEQNA